MLLPRSAPFALGIFAVLACRPASTDSGISTAQAERGADDGGASRGDSAVPLPVDGGATASLPALVSEPPIVPLTVAGFPEAVISIPLGATGPLPVVVATHGMWDFPEGLCDDQRYIFGNRAWVVCPRGRPLADNTFRYDSALALRREIDADVQALADRYPGYVDHQGMLYTGFSWGAILGVTIITDAPATFPRAVLIEGGEDKWTPSLAARYARGGGRRILFACGLRGRLPVAEAAASTLERAGVGARAFLGHAPDAGQFIHWYNGPIADETRTAQPWLFEADARWGVRQDLLPPP